MRHLRSAFLVGAVLAVVGLFGRQTAAQNACTGRYALVVVQTSEQQAVDVNRNGQICQAHDKSINPYWKDDRIIKKR